MLAQVVAQAVGKRIWTGELMGFADGLAMGCEKGVKHDSKFLVWCCHFLR